MSNPRSGNNNDWNESPRCVDWRHPTITNNDSDGFFGRFSSAIRENDLSGIKTDRDRTTHRKKTTIVLIKTIFGLRLWHEKGFELFFEHCLLRSIPEGSVKETN